MFNINNLNNILVDESVKNKIILHNEKELELSFQLLNFTENFMFSQINNISAQTPDDDVINASVLLLFIQGVKSCKSSLLLCIEGYYTNSIIIARNIIETIFNIMYLFESPEQSIERANNYLCNNNKWADESIRNKAYLTYNSSLYNTYRMTSEYTHSNIASTSKNYDEKNSLSASPSDLNIEDSITLINSVYYYLIEFLCKLYKIDFTCMDNIKKSKAFKQRYKTFKMFNFSKRRYR